MAKVRYSYLSQQFSDPGPIFEELGKLVASGGYTLGKQVTEFEGRFADMLGVRHAIGVGSGTDALKLSLKALDIGPGDEVITAANTFIATVGAIHETGAHAAFVDCEDHFCMDVSQVEGAITPRTKAIMPVQFTGEVTDMPRLMEIATRHRLPVVEDACQGILSEISGKKSGSWGISAGFSLHPLKNLNVWGDGGMIVTNDDQTDKTLRLLRNHGLVNRDEVVMLGCNSRLDTLQAVVGNWLIGQTPSITDRRIANGAYYDEAFRAIPGLRLPPRRPDVKRVFHLYIVFAEERDALLQHCLRNGVEAKVHYPIPLYQQEGLRFLGYTPGRFPVTDRHAKEAISFPVDQHLSRDEQDQVIDVVLSFYAGK